MTLPTPDASSVRNRISNISSSAWQTVRQTIRQGTPRAVLLMYHRVADAPVDPWRLCVSPSHFAEHMDLLRARSTVWSLSAYAERFRRGVPPRRALVITFDDGYIDNLTTALPLLEARGLPATFFVPTGLLGTRRPFWWDTLTDCVLHSAPLPEQIALDDPSGTATVNIRVPAGSAGDPEFRRAIYHELWTLLSNRPPADRSLLLDQLCAVTHTEQEAPASRRLMTPEEVTRLADRPGMEVGAHTVSHTPLPVLPPETQREELRRSRQVLQNLTGNPVPGLSYPNGAYDDATQRLAADLGFSHACTTAWEAATWTNSPFALPRLHVPDVGAASLDQFLASILD